MEILKSRNGVFLKKLTTPDNKVFYYTVTAPNLPIPDKTFQMNHYEDAIEYFNLAIHKITNATIFKIEF